MDRHTRRRYCCFDGINIKYVTQEEGLISNRIYDLQYINDNMIVACKGGVSVLSSDLSVISSYKFESTDEFAQAIINFKNQIYIGSNKGLYQLKDSLKSQTSFEGQQVFSFFKEQGQKLWVCTDKGISLLSNPLNRINRARGLKNEAVTSCVSYNDGWLIGTYGSGIWYYDKSAEIKRFNIDKRLRNAIVLKILLKDRNLWIATMNNGLFRYDYELDQLTQFTNNEGLSNNNVRELVTDNWGNLWIGTSGGGVSIFNNSPFVSYNKSNGLNSNYIYTVLKDKNQNLWVGTQGLGIQKINDTLSVLLDEESGFKSVKTKAIYEDSRGNIWLGTEGEGLGKVVKNLTGDLDSVVMYKQSDGFKR